VLGHLNDDRGGHSWGFVGFKDDGEFQVKRGLGKIGANAYELVGYNRLFLHTRFATHGNKTVENAHPFEIGSVVGAHNGVLSNHHELLKKYNRDFAVDSMHLIAHLDENRGFEDIQGYGALEWFYTDDPSSVLISRMRNGDLAVYGIGDDPKDTDGIVWSSREDHLRKALEVAGIKNSFRYSIDEGAVFSVQNGNLYVTKMRAELASGTYQTHNWRSYSVADWDDDGEIIATTSNHRKSRDSKGGDRRRNAYFSKSAEDSAKTFLLASTSTVDDEEVTIEDLSKLSPTELLALIDTGALDEDDLIQLGVITEDQLLAEKSDEKDENDFGGIHSVPLSNDTDANGVELWHQFMVDYAQNKTR
jgi:hypothetical protein